MGPPSERTNWVKGIGGKVLARRAVRGGLPAKLTLTAELRAVCMEGPAGQGPKARGTNALPSQDSPRGKEWGRHAVLSEPIFWVLDPEVAGCQALLLFPFFFLFLSSLQKF